MGVNLIYSQVAKDDLRSIFDYIKKDSKYYARQEVSIIRSFIKKIKTDIYLGKVFEKYNSELFREAIFRNYRIIYEIASSDKIVILTIHHYARLLSNNPAFDNED